MSGLTVWVCSIVGITMLTVLADVVMPQGQTAKYIKSVLSIVVVFVLVQPLPLISKEGLGWFNLTEQSELLVDYSFVNSVNELKKNEIDNALRSSLEELGYVDITFDILFDYTSVEPMPIKVVLRVDSLEDTVVNGQSESKNEEDCYTKEQWEQISLFVANMLGIPCSAVTYYTF